MKKTESACAIMFLIGIVFLIYGWFQQADFSAHSSIYKEIFIKRTAKTYAFTISGVMLIFISYVIDSWITRLRKEKVSLLKRIDELEMKVKNMSK